MKNIYRKSVFMLLAASLMVVSCDGDKPKPVEPPTPAAGYTIPTTYTFDKCDTTLSRLQLNMLGELTTYIKTTHSNTVAPVLDAQKLKDYFSNVSNLFSTSELNGAASLKSKCASSFQTGLEANFDAIVLASQNAAANATSTTASEGVSGKLINGTRYILVDKNGFEFKEYAEKGLMSAVFYYQVSSLLNSIATLDNSSEVDGLTAQERTWDQAFGYFGVPVNFPAVTTGLKNWGSYCNSASNALAGNTLNGESSLNKVFMKAWISGRAAISNNDLAGRDAAVTAVLSNWEKVIAARFITYTKGALANLAEPATCHHNLSEAVGFIDAFGYNSKKTVSDADIAIIRNLFKTNDVINLYRVSPANLNAAIAKMAALFNLDASKL